MAASDAPAGTVLRLAPEWFEGDITPHALVTYTAGRASTTVPAVTAPTVPAASTTLTNSTGYDVMVYVTGGTSVTVSVNGTSTGLASGGFYVHAGGTINLGAYSAAPTWVWQAV